MSYKQFLPLFRWIRFNDRNAIVESRKSDKLPAIHYTCDSLVQNSLKSHNASEFITIDEMLHPFRDR